MGLEEYFSTSANPTSLRNDVRQLSSAKKREKEIEYVWFKSFSNQQINSPRSETVSSICPCIFVFWMASTGSSARYDANLASTGAVCDSQHRRCRL